MKELREYRESKKWTQEELAKKCGVKRSAIGMWENGERKPDIIMLKRLACILDCTTDDLLASIPVPDVKI